jgi:hypothetical protein
MSGERPPHLVQAFTKLDTPEEVAVGVAIDALARLMSLMGHGELVKRLRVGHDLRCTPGDFAGVARAHTHSL